MSKSQSIPGPVVRAPRRSALLLCFRPARRRRDQAGLASLGLILLVAFVLMALGISGLEVSLYNRRASVREEARAQTTNLAEAGIQRIELDMWGPFRDDLDFTENDRDYTGATTSVLKGTISANLPPDTAYSPSVIRRFSASVIGYSKTDGFTRDITIKSVGWLDTNNSGGSLPTAGEPSTILVQQVRMKLARAGVFDYVYFVNNFGYMQGFTAAKLFVNGDMRANGDMDVNGGTINGQIIAAPNPYLYQSDNLTLGAPGIATVSTSPTVVNRTNAQYTTDNASFTQAQQAYNSAIHGAKNSDTFANWKEVLYDQTADPTITQLNGQMFGSVISDSTGTKQLSNRAQLNTTSTKTVSMPDLSDIESYKNKSKVWTDTQTKFLDGTTNPLAGQPPFVEVWNSSKNAYQRLSGQSSDPVGVITTNAQLIGDDAHPIKIHGPVTVVGDIAIKGTVTGQGIFYAGRNVHIIGDVKYADPPSFIGTNQDTIDKANEKKTVMGLCARGSIIMGDTTVFASSSTNPIPFMRPPTTRARINDVTKEKIDAFDGTKLDTGYSMTGGGTPMKYQSLLGNSWIHANATSPTRIDAIMYTNNCAGGQVGDGSTKGFTINGTVISKDEAMFANLGSGVMRMNYDSRIKQRSANQRPLIDIDLPRTPGLYPMGWLEVLK